MNDFDLGRDASLVFLFLTLASVASFFEIMGRRVAAMLWGRPENRFDRIGARTWMALKYALGQYRMPQELGPGLFHIFIFAGFIVVSLRTLTLFGIGITGSAAFHLPLLGEEGVLGQAYSLFKEVIDV